MWSSLLSYLSALMIIIKLWISAAFCTGRVLLQLQFICTDLCGGYGVTLLPLLTNEETQAKGSHKAKADLSTHFSVQVPISVSWSWNKSGTRSTLVTISILQPLLYKSSEYIQQRIVNILPFTSYYNKNQGRLLKNNAVNKYKEKIDH